MWTHEVLFCSLSRFWSLMVFRTACFFQQKSEKLKTRLHPACSGCIYTSTQHYCDYCAHTHTLTLAQWSAEEEEVRRSCVAAPFVCLSVCLSLALLSPLLGCHGNSPTHSVRHIPSTWQPAPPWVNGRSRAAAAARSRTKIKSSRCSWKPSGYSHSSRK